MAGRLGYPVVELPDEVISSDSVISYLVRQLAEQGRIPMYCVSRVACQVVRRERQGSTVLATGIALPHSKTDVPRPIGIIGRSSAPIPWESSCGVNVYEVCLLLLPASDPKEYLRALKEAADNLSESKPS